MNNSPFHALITLVNCDQRLAHYDQTINTIVQDVDQLKNRQNAIHQEAEQAKRTVIEMRKNVDLQELAMKELDLQERNKKKQLENLHNYKEYQSIKSELEHIQEQQQVQEQEVIGAWNKLESAQSAYGALQPIIEDKVVAIESAIKQAMHDLQINEQEKVQLLLKRPTLEQQVPTVWLEKYTVMRARVANPIIPVEQESCSACFYPLTGQDILQVKQGALIQCKGCYRLLFLEQIHGSINKASRLE